VVAGVLVGLIWAIENPQAGIIEFDEDVDTADLWQFKNFRVV
jgi:homospermidine synthase